MYEFTESSKGILFLHTFYFKYPLSKCILVMRQINIWNWKKCMKNIFILNTVKQNSYAVVHVHTYNNFS